MGSCFGCGAQLELGFGVQTPDQTYIRDSGGRISVLFKLLKVCMNAQAHGFFEVMHIFFCFKRALRN